MRFEKVHSVRPYPAAVLDPGPGLLQGLWFQPAGAGLAVPAAADQSGPLEHPDVLRHGLQAHRVGRGEVLDGRLSLG